MVRGLSTQPSRPKSVATYWMSLNQFVRLQNGNEMKEQKDAPAFNGMEECRYFLEIPPSERHCSVKMDSIREDSISKLTVSPKPKLRSCSMKKPKRPIIEYLDEIRPRTSSLPTRNDYKRQQYLSPTVSTEGELYRVRSFERTSKGIINRGDSFKSKSSNSIVSSGSSTADPLRLSRSPSVNSQGSTEASLDSATCQVFKVYVIGSTGVGKTALMQQFMTSEYIGGFDTSLDGESEKVVTVVLDGEESDLSFFEINTPVQTEMDDTTADSYVVIYSLTSRRSFDEAVDVLYKLRKQDHNTSSIIIVANKSDLVRTRHISTEEGKSVAKTYDCKYIETSTVLNHQVDELLVGILSQLRLKLEQSPKTPKDSSCYKHGAKCLLERIFKKDKSHSKSCENLYVL